MLDEERALYNTTDAIIKNCKFDGLKDGESAIKECKNIYITDCYFNLRYPLWHNKKVDINKSVMTENCRAALWYSSDIKIIDSTLDGIKLLRECNDIDISNSKIDSDEFGWKNKNINIVDSKINGKYAFFETNSINIERVKFSGKYSFQYTKNVEVVDSILDTKDAFWHAENITLRNCYVKGEYLGWYAKNIIFIDCTIEGTQPLCYADDIKIINCKMINCDLAFENTNVNAVINGHIDSIKNPLSGKIFVDSVGDIIQDDQLYGCKGEVIINKK